MRDPTVDRSKGDVGSGEETQSSGEQPVRTLVRGLMVLRCFDVTHPAWSYAEIRNKVGLSNATIHRLLKTLQAEGFLTINPETGKYHLGPSLIQIAYLTIAPEELARVAHPHMAKLANLTGDNVDLGVWTEQGVLHVHWVFTSRPFVPIQRVGQIFSDCCHASAKVFLAFGPESRCRAALSKSIVPCTEYSITDPQKLAAELDRVRREGVAYDMEEHTMGVCAVAAPVRDATGEVRAALSVTPPVERFGPAEMRKCADALKIIARELSLELGYRESSVQPGPS